ncbi:sodium/glutamate symporter [Comamonas endophytica]|uniref:Sodium/glutamate symporter n=1 Tax=Comamonas endophytica TaxID=2949090 RepID=A0ABY6GB60_9BURK|nr:MULTISPECIES: sodium/glutamate symporter [unclassified Acidovorax]MCD2513689.1 sodium/glutamate symporter [Acidovorax sp. D4N7]UYG52304.1 sodium/glutamate symporter [Acidovorax sp. 5MLIR]
MQLSFSTYYTLICAALVLLAGKFLVQRIRFLRDFNIPEPVAGGLVAAALIFAVHEFTGYSITFSSGLQTGFMLLFFSSIGLSANFSKLREGGSALVLFLFIISIFIVVQNAVGIGLAAALGLDPLIGLIAGSITLVGGHGTAGAWAGVFEKEHGIQGALTLGIACATFGLVIGGLIGGPLAKGLVTRHRLRGHGDASVQSAPDEANFENPQKIRLITTNAAIETLALFAACLGFAEFMTGFAQGTAFELPTFVWALGGGVILRNTLDYVFKFQVFDRAIDLFGNVSLSIYLAIALLSLKLWELSGLAAPLMVILLAQTLTMGLYAAFVTFRVMGRNYDAAVLAAGHCGFGMGATPTAIANMQAITTQYGPSHKSFLIVPMVGAFFIDIVNAGMIQLFIKLLP